MYKENLKTVVLEAMKSAKITKRQAADRLGMSMPTWYNFEKRGKISLEDYVRLCEMLKLEVLVVPGSYLR
jgi:transcriptional regulator with XRE-family HTH domain